MSSGLTVSPKSIESYNGISSRKFRVLILRADPNEIVLENSFGPGSGNVEMDWKEVVATLPDDDCRFLVCDFQMQETPTVTKSKIIFVSWSPDTSPIRTKTIYASSREAVVGVMPVQRSIQATEKDELAYPDVKNAVFSG